MKQPHTEGDIEHTEGEQETGNHRAPGTPAKVPGGTRIGADNVEPTPRTSQDHLDDSLSVNGPTEGK